MTDTITQAARIVAAYVRHHRIGVEEVPLLIATVRRTLETLGTPTEPQGVERKPAVPIRRSVTPDHIVCLEDGRKLKMLKRHLRTLRHDAGGVPGALEPAGHLPDDRPDLYRHALRARQGAGPRPNRPAATEGRITGAAVQAIPLQRPEDGPSPHP